MPVRVLLSCKHKVIAEGIAAVIRTHPDLDLVGISDEDEETKKLLMQTHPEVLVMGVDPQMGRDLELTRWLAEQGHRPEIVAFCTACDKGLVLQMMQAGASGLVSTHSSMQELLQAIRAAAAGRSYLCPSISRQMAEVWRRGRASDGSRGHLGEREEQVLRLIADGYSSKEIARNLQIAPSTVEVHRRNIMRKVGLHKVADLTRYAIRNQMVSA